MSDADPYSVLGVNPTAPPEVVRGAWMALSKVHHPDSGSRPDAARMAEVNAAYEAITQDRPEGDLGAATTGAGASGAWADDPVAPMGEAGWGDEPTVAPPPPGSFAGTAGPAPGAPPAPGTPSPQQGGFPTPPAAPGAPVGGVAAPPPPPIGLGSMGGGSPVGGGGGYPPPPGRRGGYAPAGQQTTNTLSWVSLLVTVLCFPPIGAILALVARSQIKNSNGMQKGKVWANLALIWFGLLVVAWVLIVVIAAGSSNDPSTTTTGF